MLDNAHGKDSGLLYTGTSMALSSIKQKFRMTMSLAWVYFGGQMAPNPY